MEKTDDERAPVNAKIFVVNGSKRGRPKKKWKEIVEKDVLAKGLKSSDAHNYANVESRLQKPAHLNPPENKLASRKMKLIVNTPETNGDDELRLNTTNIKVKSIKENVTV